MKLLELFSGTQSIGRAFEALGWEVTSLDILPGASITTDILNWDYRAHALPGHYDFIWASPPCTQYSIAKTIGARDLQGADAIVRRTLDIIEYFRPGIWLMENPQTGCLKHRAVVAGLPFRDVTYCKYGFRYKKKTRLWGDLPGFEPKACSKRDPCEHLQGGQHPATAQHGTNNHRGGSHSLRELYRLPPALCSDIAAAADVWALLVNPWTSSSGP